MEPIYPWSLLYAKKRIRKNNMRIKKYFKNYIFLWFLIAAFDNSYANEIKNQDMPWYIDTIKADSYTDKITGKDSMVMLIDPFDSPYAIPKDLEPLKKKVYYLNTEFAKPMYAFTDTPPLHESQHVSEHATALAGLIAGYRTELKRIDWLPPWLFNNILIAGIAPDSKIVVVGTKIKLITGWPLFLNAYETSFNLKNIPLSDKNGVQKYIFNDKQNTCIINFSAGRPESKKIDEELDEVLEYLKGKNVLLVVAAGNEGVDFDSKRTVYYFPQEAKERDNLIVVGATGYKSTTLSEFSNRSNKTVGIAAPGEDIPILEIYNTGRYDSGTSFSAPLVSGALALAIECNPLIEAAELKEKLYENAATYSHLKKDIKNGRFLNVKNLLKVVCFSDDGFKKGIEEKTSNHENNNEFKNNLTSNATSSVSEHNEL
jgi:subtilisin family serine protease